MEPPTLDNFTERPNKFSQARQCILEIWRQLQYNRPLFFQDVDSILKECIQCVEHKISAKNYDYNSRKIQVKALTTDQEFNQKKALEALKTLVSTTIKRNCQKKKSYARCNSAFWHAVRFQYDEDGNPVLCSNADASKQIYLVFIEDKLDVEYEEHSDGWVLQTTTNRNGHGDLDLTSVYLRTNNGTSYYRLPTWSELKKHPIGDNGRFGWSKQSNETTLARPNNHNNANNANNADDAKEIEKNEENEGANDDTGTDYIQKMKEFNTEQFDWSSVTAHPVQTHYSATRPIEEATHYTIDVDDFDAMHPMDTFIVEEDQSHFTGNSNGAGTVLTQSWNDFRPSDFPQLINTYGHISHSDFIYTDEEVERLEREALTIPMEPIPIPIPIQVEILSGDGITSDNENEVNVVNVVNEVNEVNDENNMYYTNEEVNRKEAETKDKEETDRKETEAETKDKENTDKKDKEDTDKEDKEEADKEDKEEADRITAFEQQFLSLEIERTKQNTKIRKACEMETESENNQVKRSANEVNETTRQAACESVVCTVNECDNGDPGDTIMNGNNVIGSHVVYEEIGTDGENENESDVNKVDIDIDIDIDIEAALVKDIALKHPTHLREEVIDKIIESGLYFGCSHRYLDVEPLVLLAVKRFPMSLRWAYKPQKQNLKICIAACTANKDAFPYVDDTLKRTIRNQLYRDEDFEIQPLSVLRSNQSKILEDIMSKIQSKKLSLNNLK